MSARERKAKIIQTMRVLGNSLDFFLVLRGELLEVVDSDLSAGGGVFIFCSDMV